MKARFNIFSTLLLSGLILGGCVADIDTAQEAASGAGYGDLTFSVNIPDVAVDTKSLAYDPVNADASWTDWDKFVDGSLLYRVTIFVIDANNTLVGYRDVYSGSSDLCADTGTYGANGFWETSAVNVDAETGIAVKATFLADNPMHGDAERLQEGDYTVMAVANYSSCTETDGTYEGLGSSTTVVTGADGNFTTVVDNIIAAFNQSPATGLANFNATNYPAFFNYRLDSGDDRVCSLVPQPLVMIRKVTISGEKTTLSGQLSRTFARIRIQVMNNNTNLLSISGLQFVDSFASKQAYLFNDILAGDANLHNHWALYSTTAAPITVNTSDAIYPFSSTLNFFGDGDGDTATGVTLPMFDAFILEGKTGLTYAFSFTATYRGAMKNGDASQGNIRITDLTTLAGYYLFIRSNTSSSSNCLTSVISTKSMAVEDIGSSGDNIAVIYPQFIWKMDLVSTPTSIGNERYSATCTLRSCNSGLYLQPYDGSTDMTAKIGFNPAEFTVYMNCQGMDEFGTLTCVYNGSTYYLNGEGKWALWSSSSSIGSSSNYQILTFETLVADESVNVSQNFESPILKEVSGTTTLNEAVRNDYYTETFNFTRTE